MNIADYITLKEVLQIMKDPELAYASTEFWVTFGSEFDEDGEISQETWNRLWIFQVGWLKCKQFYEREQNERSSTGVDTEERPGI